VPRRVPSRLARPFAGAPPARRRGTLAGRIALVTTAVAAVAVLVAGLVSLSLVNRAGDADARRTLSALADAAAEGAGGNGRLGDGSVALGRQRTRNQLNALKIDFTFLTRPARPAAARPTAWPAGR
jgi:hypothetical protein